MYRQDQYVFEAIKAGARAYLLKDADSDELLRSIRIVAGGEALLDPAIALKMMDEFRRYARDARRREVARRWTKQGSPSFLTENGRSSSWLPRAG
jgi:DNA-binding NarL/FixJ family response regulator